MKSLTPIALTLVLATTSVAAEAGDKHHKKKFAKPDFTELDTNANGEVDLEEFTAYVKTKIQQSKMFSHLDTDQDGFISQAEFDEKAQKHKGKHYDRGERPAFSELDENNDNQISIDEVTRHRLDAGRHVERFNQMDANKNALVSQDEFDSYKPRKKHLGKKPMFSRLDLDNDGTVSNFELFQAFTDSDKVDKLLNKFDQNNDGNISRSEMNFKSKPTHR